MKLANLVLLGTFWCSSLLVGAGPTPVLPPSVDPFYKAPAGFESQPLGTILDSRPLPSPLRAIILPLQIKNSWQVLVRSQDSHGNASVIVATIMEPFNADPSKLVSYQSMQDSSDEDCSVSFAIQVNALSISTLVTQVDMLMMQSYMNEGWYVVAPDYEGTKAAFTVGVQSGQAVLDGIRASLSSTDLTGINSDAKVIMFGDSGGTIGSAWAASLQPTYAPELKDNLIGCAIGGFVTNVTSVAEAIEGTVFAGLTASAILGWAHEYPALYALANKEVVSQSKINDLFEVDGQCFLSALAHHLFDDFFTGSDRYFTKGWDLFKDPLIKEIIELNTLAVTNTGHNPEIPIFIFHSENDEVAPYESALRVYNNWCEWGCPSIEFAVDSISEHITEFVVGAPAGFSWMKNIFDGKQPISGCKLTNRFNNLQYPGAPLKLAFELNTAFESALQQPIGPDNSSTYDEVFGWLYKSPLSDIQSLFSSGASEVESAAQGAVSAVQSDASSATSGFMDAIHKFFSWW